MSFNLIDSAKGLFTNEMVSKASSYLGESESGVAKAISGILPSVLGGLVNKASDNDGAGVVASMAQESHSSGILGNLEGVLGNDGGGMLNKGAGLLSSLFGGKLDGLSGLISSFSGLKSSSVSSLMSMAAPAVLGMIGKHASNNNLGASGIASLLNSQKDNIAAAMPSGLNLSSVLGNFGSDVSNTAKTATASATNYANQTVGKSGGSMSMKILLPLLILAAVAMAVVYLFGKGCNKGTDVVADGNDSLKTTTEQVTTEVKETAAATVGKLDSLTGNFVYDLGKTISIDLPNGAGKLEVGENSTENKLYKFLSDANATLDTVKGNWFEFTNVKFKTGGSEITEESMTQLKNMVAIAKGYPTAQFKLGGYTDNTGSVAGNIALSQKRADAVAAMLVKLGADAKSFVGAKGYGPEWPVADNATAEGRAQNRRVAVNVKAK
jgi:outer membrane protein OmpA-like peptidoglycan-associated protein